MERLQKFLPLTGFLFLLLVDILCYPSIASIILTMVLILFVPIWLWQKYMNR